MKIVLDSNILCRDLRLGSHNIRLLREGLRLIPTELIVPEVVVDEVCNHYREQLEELHAKASAAAEKISRLLGGDGSIQVGDLDFGHKEEAYRSWLLAQLDTLKAEVPEYPEIPHKKVVLRALQRRKPFQKKGTGYRDYLIWETIKRITLVDSERVAFVTANRADFFDGEDLAEDLKEDIFKPDRVRVYSSLKQFNEELVTPKLREATELKKQLEDAAGAAVDIAAVLKAEILDLIRDEENLGPIVAGLPPDAGSVFATGISEFLGVRIEEVRELSNDERLLSVSMEVDVEFNVDFDWDDYMRYSEVRDWIGSDGEWFSYSSADIVERLTLGVHVLLAHRGTEVVDKEVVRIEGPTGEMELETW